MLRFAFRSVIISFLLLWGGVACCRANDKAELAERNLSRGLELMEAAKTHYFTGGSRMIMYRWYNPVTGNNPSEIGSVWMYTSAIEATVSLMDACAALKETGRPQMYDAHFQELAAFLRQLYDGLEWYRGTYTLTSYTQTRSWQAYAVDRARRKGAADVNGKLNVYDDQEWLIRELLSAYRLTGETAYLEKAEYLAEYVIDGWDCTLAPDGSENGGITWGPGYSSKHSCSNGPFISPLVWLSEIYKGKEDTAVRRYIGVDGERLTETLTKEQYYLSYARKVYDFQKNRLYSRHSGVYWDMIGGSPVSYETINGERYRAHSPGRHPSGKFYPYNTGTMLSGAADLYRVTGEERYLSELVSLQESSCAYFLQPSESMDGFFKMNVPDVPDMGAPRVFNTWFYGVLLRGWIDGVLTGKGTDFGVNGFQKNLDYAYENRLRDGTLPAYLLGGWNEEDVNANKVEALFSFSYIADYGALAKYLTETL